MAVGLTRARCAVPNRSTDRAEPFGERAIGANSVDRHVRNGAENVLGLASDDRSAVVDQAAVCHDAQIVVDAEMRQALTSNGKSTVSPIGSANAATAGT